MKLTLLSIVKAIPLAADDQFTRFLSILLYSI